MGSDSDDEVIVRAVVDLARNLGLGTIAEGVEDRETWEQLSRLGLRQRPGLLPGPPHGRPGSSGRGSGVPGPGGGPRARRRRPERPDPGWTEPGAALTATWASSCQSQLPMGMGMDPFIQAGPGSRMEDDPSARQTAPEAHGDQGPPRDAAVGSERLELGRALLARADEVGPVGRPSSSPWTCEGTHSPPPGWAPS